MIVSVSVVRGRKGRQQARKVGLAAGLGLGLWEEISITDSTNWRFPPNSRSAQGESIASWFGY